MDDTERAQDLEEKDREIGLAQHTRRPRPEPRDDCATCGVELAAHRKEFGSCIACQNERERIARHYRKE